VRLEAKEPPITPRLRHYHEHSIGGFTGVKGCLELLANDTGFALYWAWRQVHPQSGCAARCFGIVTRLNLNDEVLGSLCVDEVNAHGAQTADGSGLDLKLAVRRPGR
jgi:hypothetical protein